MLVYLASQNIKTPVIYEPSNPSTSIPSTSTVFVPPLEIFESAWCVKQSWGVPSSTRILIAPHHAIAGKEIASLFSSLPFQPTTVFLISPDHFSQGRTDLTTTLDRLTSFQATSTVDREVIARLIQDNPTLQIASRPFSREHGVHALLPFLARAWPQSTLVPILIKDKTNDKILEHLASQLVSELRRDTKALVIISSDFSHYLPAELADFHDEKTAHALQTLDVSAVPQLEIDVPGVLTVGLSVARSLGLQDVRIHAHTNSLRLAHAQFSQDSTSHFLVSFSDRGDVTHLYTAKIKDIRTTLIFAPLTFGIPDPLHLLRGQEDRVLRGQDAIAFMNDVVFGENDERFEHPLGNKSIYIAAQFGARLSLFAESTRKPPSLHLIRTKDTDPSFLHLHFPDDPQALQLSLGWVSTSYQDGTEREKIYLYPMRMSQNGSAFLVGKERAKALKEIAKLSSPELRSQILQGIVEW